jgi:endonuclease YncB( thermonuclease family)
MKKVGILVVAAAILATAIGLAVYFVAFHNRGFPVGTISPTGEADGDTFSFQRTHGASLPSGADKVRLLGIDAPDKCEGDEDPCFLCGERDQAAQGLRQAAGSEEFRLERYGQASLGRWLGIAYPVRNGDQSLNERLVREGFARIYKIDAESLSDPEFPAGFEERLLEAQVEAALDRVGMWSDPKYNDGVHIVAIRYWGDNERVILVNFSETPTSLSNLTILGDAKEEPSKIPAGNKTLEARESESISCLKGTWRDEGAKVFLVETEPAAASTERKPDYCYRGF